VPAVPIVADTAADVAVAAVASAEEEVPVAVVDYKIHNRVPSLYLY